MRARPRPSVPIPRHPKEVGAGIIQSALWPSVGVCDHLAVGWYAGRGALLLDGVSVSGGCGPLNLGGPSIRRNESIGVPARARQPCSLS